MKKNYLSIDIGGTNVKYAELDNAGNIVEQGKIKTSHDKEQFLKNIDQIVEKYVKKGVKGLAFCAPGKIAHTKIHFGGALPFLDGIDFAERYQKYSLPVAIINDGKASVLAENWLGSLKDMKNCAAITLGTGVGGGIIVNGQLLNGAHFQAGELSFLQLNMKEPGFDGFAGGYASAVQMIKNVNEAIENDDETDGLAAFEAINNEDEKAKSIFDEYCKRIAAIIIDIQAVVDLDAIAIGGGISAQPIVVQGINQAYDEVLAANKIIRNTFTRPKIVEAKFKNGANLYGALYNLFIHVNGEKL
ncbi:transcriptional regulator [Lactobacillus johnsonii]|uniref:Transcriptional regulator n=1 Tax=Lactobacillus johnsonii TaxID=33959 RepID=A0A1Z1NBR3_LACJH|nr:MULTISPECIES: ROK family protein [Lactobacillus]ARW75234.1 transcriptional regulator [Lactobacillus johnsonii]ARW76807.1 transcriptional regulator [Lactobacillus johnsonii]MCL5443993.1 ROK family protein [Lactobacillus johnsonii]PAB45020.1 transcriptional regulator [Lactobacillus johnsonii]PAB52272.1 transcriptional regulator [Lactobacillus johnsonii]